MSIRSLCKKHRVTIQQENENRTPSGSVDRDPFTTISTKVPCFIQPASADQVLKYGAEFQETTHIVYFASDMMLNQTHSLVYAGRRFYVLAYKNTLELGRLWVALTKEREEGAEP